MATALDGAGQIFPIALVFASSETSDSWRFFVQHLANALDIRDTPLTVISDRCKGIDNAVTEFLPRAAHSFCAFHINQNTLKHGNVVVSYVWKVANVTSFREYADAIAGLTTIKHEANVYLGKIPREQFVRAFFPLPRFGHVTSNIAESINAW